MQLPKVSILIPLYNSESFIAETIASALKQTWHNKEIIIVDDHSTDSSFKIAQQFDSENIKLIKNPRKGACAARNFAFESCTGDFIQYLDADDLLSPDKIEKQMQAIIGHANKLAICNCFHFSGSIENAINTDKDFIFSSDEPADFLANLWGAKGASNFVAVHSYLSPRKLIEQAGPWNETLIKDQDGEFFARVVLSSSGLIYVPEIRSYYRRFQSANSISYQRKTQAHENNLKVTQLKEKYLLDFKNTHETKKAIASLYKELAIEAWPEYKKISRIALEKCKSLGDSSINPILGGKIVEVVKFVFGWKAAKSFSFYLHKLIKKRKFQ